MRIDEFLPKYDVTEHHQIDIHAPAGQVYAAIRALDLRSSRLIRGLFALRGFPALFSAQRKTQPGLGLTLEGLFKSGFVLLGETPPQELLLGLVGKFWTSSGCIQRLDASEFQNFTKPGFAKAVWNFVLTPQPNGITKLSTETRVLCLDETSRRRFRFYWLFIRPFSGLTRIEVLRAIKRQVTA
jgi:hypothetical protein